MKNNYIKIAAVVAFVFILSILFMEPAAAQCAMCKGAAEANLKMGGGDPKGLNKGILYMFLMPYTIVGCIGYWWWRNRRTDDQAADLTEADFGEEVVA